MFREIRYAFIVAGFVLLVGLIYVKLPFTLPTARTIKNDTRVFASSTIQIANRIVKVAVADSPEERAIGLSGSAGLAEDEGMLFVFDEDGEHAFWMKNMRFAIDIVWISHDGVIVHIEKYVRPETYPAVFVPRSGARYVAELPGGFVEKHDVHVGDVVRL